MKKYIFILFGFIALLFHQPTANAAEAMIYSNGYMDKYHNYTYTPGTGAIFDNKLNTSYTGIHRKDIVIQLTNPTEVEVIGYFARHYGWNFKVAFYEEGASTPFFSREIRYTNTTSYYINLAHKKKLSKIVLTPVNGQVIIYEFDFFINEPLDMINIFNVTSGFDEVILEWELPEKAHAVKIYLNGTHIDTVQGNGSYPIKGLKANTSYTVGMSTLTNVDGVERESLLRTVQVTTNPVPQLPNDLITVIPSGNSIKLDVDKSKFSEIPGKMNYYIDGILVATQDLMKTNTVNITGLQPGTEYVIQYEGDYGNGHITSKDSIVAETTDSIAPSNVANLVGEQNDEGIKLTYTLPTESDFSHLVISRDNKEIATNVTTTEFIDNSIKDNTKYNYTIYSVDKSGNRSTGSKLSVTTTGKEVFNVSTSTDYDRVNLSWNNPVREGFEKVKIYRKKTADSMLMRVFSTSDYKPIFETNGTVFNDLTVSSDTEYSYKLTSSYAGVETEGVILNVKTGKLTVSEGETTTDEDGNYVISWTNPIIGKMKVLIAGEQYAIVPASDKQIIIPKEDMKFTLLGDLDVTLIPIEEGGTEGVPLKPGKGESIGGVELPFSPKGLLTTGTELLSIVGGIVLLALSFILVPKLRNLIVQAFGKNKEKSIAQERRTISEATIKEKHQTEKPSKERSYKSKSVEATKVREPRLKAPRERVMRSQRISSKEPREPRQPRLRERKVRVSRAERVSR